MKSLQTIALAMIALGTSMAGNAQNISGRITCDGVGVANVPVSDGYVVTKTDANGNYSFTSQKKNGYVFYTLPRGYEPSTSYNFKTGFWQPLTSTNVSTAETHDFVIKKVDNDDHIMIVGADSHLAKRNSDRSMYQTGWINALKKERLEAVNAGKRIYSIILGDLSWDNYWYANTYNLTNFIADQQTYGYPVALFPVIGNHDNDPGVAYTSSDKGVTTDFKSSEPWRKIVCPNYYSFNLGKVHYIVLDNIFYKNEDTGGSYSKGVVGSRNYAARVEQYQLDWLAKDLADVDVNTPIIVCEHIPTFRLNSTFIAYGSTENYTALATPVKNYKEVHLRSGHTHYNYTARPATYPNMVEHNIASICATWWWTGVTNGTNVKYQVCQDGSPAGYSYWEAAGSDLKWEYRSIAGPRDMQIRGYDMNKVKEFMSTDTYAVACVKKYGATVVPNFSSYSNNAILANIYNYDSDWKVTITEGVNTKLAAYRINEFDPYHVLAFDVNRYKAAQSINTGFATEKNGHMFRAIATTSNLPITIKAVDHFGKVHYCTFQRPIGLSLDMVDQQVDADLGDVNVDGIVNVSDVTDMVNSILGSQPAGFSKITADMNGDGTINVTDVTDLINKILAQ
ncbi:MAG: calcineurin-like phosphoesterase C-terminal domain-containing protein [Muribaculaceae bacterium]|nr:calcineurin-like phosphoesterase C-terminal domain-containing protein [Muribaculaceae bacterium]